MLAICMASVERLGKGSPFLQIPMDLLRDYIFRHFEILVPHHSCRSMPEAIALAECMDVRTIHVVDSMEWDGRPTVCSKQLRIVGSEDASVTLRGKWQLAKGSGGSFENINFVNRTMTCMRLDECRWEFWNCSFR